MTIINYQLSIIPCTPAQKAPLPLPRPPLGFSPKKEPRLQG
ncbi:hypothetical protein [[Phormidium] sp. ETS-05]|nr:hypothetical protein [[Phormidium] sp. ETS-05]